MLSMMRPRTASLVVEVLCLEAHMSIRDRKSSDKRAFSGVVTVIAVTRAMLPEESGPYQYRPRRVHTRAPPQEQAPSASGGRGPRLSASSFRRLLSSAAWLAVVRSPKDRLDDMTLTLPLWHTSVRGKEGVGLG